MQHLRVWLFTSKTSCHEKQSASVASSADVWFLRKGFQFGQDGGEKFCNCRMNMHCALYDRIRRLRIHGVQQYVNDFIASGTKDRRTENLFCVSIHSDFDEAVSFSLLNSPAHSAHRMFRRECSTPRLPYFGVCHAASA